MADVKLRVSVVYCGSERAWARELEVDAGATLRTIVEASGVLTEFPALQVDTLSVGVFSKPRALDTQVHDGDRIEIYRPLVVDPKEARRVRAELRRQRKALKGT